MTNATTIANMTMKNMISTINTTGMTNMTTSENRLIPIVTATWSTQIQWTSASIIYTAFDIAIAIGAIALNLFVIIIIARFKMLRTITNAFIVSLSIADLLVGLLGIPCAILGNNGIPSNFNGCLLMNTMIVIITQISIFNLLGVALERFAAIRYPFAYEKYCDTQLASYSIVVLWILAILVGVVPLFSWNLKAIYNGQCSFTNTIDMNYMVFFNFFGCVLSPLILIAVVYAYIVTTVYKQMRQISSLNVMLTTVPFQTIVTAQKNTSYQTKTNQLMTKFKAAKSLSLLIILFAICWLPLHIINTITRNGGIVDSRILLFAILLSHFNSVANPICYGMSHSKFREAARLLLTYNKVGITQAVR